MTRRKTILFVFVSSILTALYSTSGCSSGASDDPYNKVYKNASLALNVSLDGDRLKDRAAISDKFSGQSMQQVLEFLEKVKQRHDSTYVIEWVQSPKRLDIAIGTDFQDERIAYVIVVTFTSELVAQDIRQQLLSLPVNTGSYFGNKK